MLDHVPEAIARELARCLRHEVCSECEWRYAVDPKEMPCVLADHIEAHEALKAGGYLP